MSPDSLDLLMNGKAVISSSEKIPFDIKNSFKFVVGFIMNWGAYQ